MEEGQKGVALDSCTATHCDIDHGQVIPVLNVTLLVIPDRGAQGDLKVLHLRLQHLLSSCPNRRLVRFQRYLPRMNRVCLEVALAFCIYDSVMDMF